MLSHGSISPYELVSERIQAPTVATETRVTMPLLPRPPGSERREEGSHAAQGWVYWLR